MDLKMLLEMEHASAALIASSELHPAAAGTAPDAVEAAQRMHLAVVDEAQARRDAIAAQYRDAGLGEIADAYPTGD